MRIQSMATLFILILGSISCGPDASMDDDQPSGPITEPSITTVEISDISSGSFKSGGVIIDDGGEITEKGVCWGINPMPSAFSAGESAGMGSEDFELVVDGLYSFRGYTLYARAYAINDIGVGYGEEFTFKMKVSNEPVVPPCDPSENTAIFYGNSAKTFTGASLFDNTSIGSYALKAQNSNDIVEVTFKEKPQTGVYRTQEWESVSEFYTCVIQVIDDFSGSAVYFVSEVNHPIFVEQIDDDRYSITFCDLPFYGSLGGQSLNFMSNGNITSK